MRFFKRHKVLVIILTVIILLFVAGAGYVWHLLGQIQFIERTGDPCGRGRCRSYGCVHTAVPVRR